MLSLRGCQRLPPEELDLMDRPLDHNDNLRELVGDHFPHLALVVTEGCLLITDIPQWAWLTSQGLAHWARRPALEWHRHPPPYGILDKPWHALGHYERRVLRDLGSSEASWSRYAELMGHWRYWELPVAYDPLPDRDKRLWALLGWGRKRWGKWGSMRWLPCLLRAKRV